MREEFVRSLFEKRLHEEMLRVGKARSSQSSRDRPSGEVSQSKTLVPPSFRGTRAGSKKPAPHPPPDRNPRRVRQLKVVFLDERRGHHRSHNPKAPPMAATARSVKRPNLPDPARASG